MGAWSESFLWASMFWGAVGSGYMVYGWRQRSMMPFIAGIAMTAVACFVPALPMTLLSLIIIFGCWWLMRQGY
jgi:hypothetical protein